MVRNIAILFIVLVYLVMAGFSFLSNANDIINNNMFAVTIFFVVSYFITAVLFIMLLKITLKDL